jgi:hypothetical protein
MDHFDYFVGWIGIVAFLLAIPMSILANMLTPKIQAWWANTSSARKARRIQYLQREIPWLERSGKLTFRLERLILGVRVLALGLIAITYVLYFLNGSINHVIDHIVLGTAAHPPGYIYPTGWRSTRLEMMRVILLTCIPVAVFYRAMQHFRWASGIYVSRRERVAREELARLVDKK